MTNQITTRYAIRHTSPRKPRPHPSNGMHDAADSSTEAPSNPHTSLLCDCTRKKRGERLGGEEG